MVALMFFLWRHTVGFLSVGCCSLLSPRSVSPVTLQEMLIDEDSADCRLGRVASTGLKSLSFLTTLSEHSPPAG